MQLTGSTKYEIQCRSISLIITCKRRKYSHSFFAHNSLACPVQNKLHRAWCHFITSKWKYKRTDLIDLCQRINLRILFGVANILWHNSIFDLFFFLFTSELTIIFLHPLASNLLFVFTQLKVSQGSIDCLNFPSVPNFV